MNPHVIRVVAKHALIVGLTAAAATVVRDLIKLKENDQ